MTQRSTSIGYLLVVIGIAIWLIVERGQSMLNLFNEIKLWPLLIIVVASILPFFANIAFWTIALRELGETVTWKQVTEASAETTLTRYLPGGVWLAASRSVALARKGVRTPALVALIGLEMALGTPVAILVGTLFLSGSESAPLWLVWIAGGAILILATVGRPLLNTVLAWWTKRRNQPAPTPLKALALIRLVGILSVYWIAFGTIFWGYLFAMNSELSWLTATGAFALSWRIGLFAVFAPQGLGIFEPALLALVGWSTDALLLVGAFRMVLLIRDLIVTTITIATKRNNFS